MTELIIPEARTDAARMIAERSRPILAVMPNSEVRQQFIVAAVSAANQLAGCTPESVVMGVYHLAMLGLPPGPLGLAWLIPFKDKRKSVTNAQVVVGYKGFLSLAYDAGYLSVIEADVVLSGETFQHFRDESGSHVNHVLGLERSIIRQNIVAAYCVWTTRDGTKGVRVVGKAEIDRVAKDNDIWRQNYPAMGMKTALRRAAPLWRFNLQNLRLARAITLEDQAEADEEQDLGERLPGGEAKSREVSLDDFGDEDGQPAAEPAESEA